MQYRQLGPTDMEVSILSYGASSLGSVFREVPEDEGIATVRRALDLGINLIDVSPYYGMTKAETVLGKALDGVDRDRYYLATKCGRYGATVDQCDYSAARVTRSVDESLSRLGVDRLDIIQVHDVEFGDVQQIVHETLPALDNIRRDGNRHRVGFRVGSRGPSPRAVKPERQDRRHRWSRRPTRQGPADGQGHAAVASRAAAW